MAQNNPQMDLAHSAQRQAEKSAAQGFTEKNASARRPEKIFAQGFAYWKWSFVRKFFQPAQVEFCLQGSELAHDPETAIAVWGSAPVDGLPNHNAVLRMEDGFLRSSGLGADLVRPLSLVIDDMGIYYDSTQPSRLEHILNTQDLSQAALQRAKELRGKIIALQVTKYNLGHQNWTRPATDQAVILVVGQVENDASLRFGAPDVCTNIELLQRVKSEHPDAYILYKPHPDVVAGLRNTGQGEADAQQYCDEILSRPVSIDRLFEQVDALHTMTSLMGFEALLRGVKTVCHGLPFYAGWGLSEDRLHCSRRAKNLSLDALTHGVLISYPSYYDYECDDFTTPERAVDMLARASQNGPSTLKWHRRILRIVLVSWLKLTHTKRGPRVTED